MKEEYEKYRKSWLEYFVKNTVEESGIGIFGVGVSPGITGVLPGIAGVLPGIGAMPAMNKQLAEFVKNRQEPFNKCLFRMIDEKGLKDSDVYKQSGLTRQMFSKIRCKPDYIPTKSVMLSLAVGMQLTVQETEKLLASGNQLLSRSDTGDLIVRFFMEQGEYDIDLYNAYLFEYHQHLLGSTTKEQ